MAKTDPKGVLKPGLWQDRPVAETMAVYRDWAATYDAEVTARGYHTPARIATELARHLGGDPRPILDFGCGTGLSGWALRAVGIGPRHGTDIVPAMVDQARPLNLYDRLWVSEPGDLDVAPGTYQAIVAAGVISLGAAPPETLDLLVAALGPGDVLALSFNDPSLEHGGYDAQLQSHIEAGRLTLLHREHGPHLDDVDMGSDVIILRRI
ncbi:MAG: methyltransferase domain-containing protein [Pseudomonadota bacterium]